MFAAHNAAHSIRISAVFPLHFVCISAPRTGAEFDKGCSSRELYLSLRHHNASPAPVTGVIGQLLPLPRPENHPPLVVASSRTEGRVPSTETTISIIEATFSPQFFFSPSSHPPRALVIAFTLHHCLAPTIASRDRKQRGAKIENRKNFKN